MYKCVKSYVFINGEKSRSFACSLVIRQGECLSPFMFAMYINDLKMSLADNANGITVDDLKVFLILYADDAVIVSDTPEGLQSEIDILFEYCRKWKLVINRDKSGIVVFGRRKFNPVYKWYYDGNELKVMDKIKYLGLNIINNGNFNQTQITLSEQARKALFCLYKRLSDFKYLQPFEVIELFDKCISPILNYACEIWGFHPAMNIERVHLSFCKKLLFVKQSTQNNFVYGILGRFPMYVMRHVRIIKYWLK